MANRTNIQDNIQRVSNKIIELNTDLKTRKELSVLDIDLLRKHAIDLYDEVNQLRLVMKEVVEVEEEVKVEEMRNDEEVRSHGETGGLGDEETARQNDEGVSSEEEDKPEVRHPEQANDLSDPEETSRLVEGHELKLAAAEAKVEADAIKAAQNPEEANDLAFKFSNTPIHDLKKAISIAKKFEFINTLFEGNVEKYAYSIHHINNLNSGDEAFTYLHDLRAEWKWDDEDKNFQELANLIRRRFLG